MNLNGHTELKVVQRKELGELLGMETRNKYEIRDTNDTPIGFAAEQGKGFLAWLARQYIGHWRVYDVLIFDLQRQPVYRAHHPFRWFFQRFEVFDAQGRKLGALQQRWAFLSREFDVEDANGNVIMNMKSGFFSVWTYPFFKGGEEVGRVEKKWSGLLKEAFTDADNFKVTFSAVNSVVERALLLAASVFIDLQYFERKAR